MKLTIDIDDETGDLLQSLAATTRLSVTSIIDKLLSAHLHELWELKAFLDESQCNSEVREQALNLLVSYGGGESLLAGLARIAPYHETNEARFVRSIHALTPSCALAVQ